MDLSRFDAKRFAVVLNFGGAVRVIRGAARYEPDPSLGAVLRIGPPAADAPASGTPVFVLQEDTWNGRLSSDDQYGCDFQLELDVTGTPVANGKVLQAAG